MRSVEKLASLRALMKARHLKGYVIPTSDAHNSEYVAAAHKRREYISGFSGSAGTAVVTADDARLWTDGRYFLQAEKELDASAGWKLMKDRLPETPSIEAWLASTLAKGETVGLDPTLFTIASIHRMQHALHKVGVRLDTSAAHGNLVDEVWGSERPNVPSSPTFLHDEIRYAGRKTSEKLVDVRAALAKEGASALVIAALDEIAWLFNIRGRDIECNPVSIAFGLVTLDSATLFIDPAKVPSEVEAKLKGDGVTCLAYEGLADALASTEGKIWLDPSFCSYAVYEAAKVVTPRKEGGATTSNESTSASSSNSAASSSSSSSSSSASASDEARILQKMSPIQLLKAIKNEREIEGMRAAHLRDGVALTSFFAWLEAAVVEKVDSRTGVALSSPVTEVSASDVLESYRREQSDFFDLSFATIAGVGPNGAIIHYHADASSAAEITSTAVFLCDSGAQYRDGTTDVTRTLHFGEPTAHERHCYTRILQGHIAMARARFPPGTLGVALDTLARAPLWQSGLDYRHGTGHGVGAFLNVHEGPFGASPVARTAYEGGIQAGMTLTDEPGYYEDGAFGIRIENILIAKTAATPHTFGGKAYLDFECFTVAPITTRLVDASLLSPEERHWLNSYNASVRDKLSPLLSSNALALKYLEKETTPI